MKARSPSRGPAHVAGDPPRGEFEREAGEVGLEDLGSAVSLAAAVFDLAPQAVRDAGLGAAGPARALIGRGPTRRHRRQPAEPRSCVEARLAGEPGVDDDPHAVDRQRRLGDVGRQHDPPSSGRRRCERPVLFLERERAGEGVHVDVGRDGVRSARRAIVRHVGSRRCPAGTPARRRRRSRAPAGRGDDVGSIGSSRRVAPGRGRPLRPDRPPRAAPARASVAPATGAASARRRRTSGRRSSITGASSTRRRPSVSGVADIATIARSGRIVAATSIVNASAVSAVRLRSCTSSKITAPTPGQLGVVLEPPRQHALGDDLDAGVRAPMWRSSRVW